MQNKVTINGSRPRIAVTMGDPAGVGPEICLDLLNNAEIIAQCTPIIFGSAAVLKKCAEKTGRPQPTLIVEKSSTSLSEIDAPAVLNFQNNNLEELVPGEVSHATGQASYDYIIAAIDSAIDGEVDAVATAPIHKEALHSAGVIQPGHTEIFAERTGAERSCMILTSEQLTCSLVTVHVGYDKVPALLSVERIAEVIDLTRAAMRRIRKLPDGQEPRLIVCGLNPHAGEGGLFGNNEEENLIIPAIERARADGAVIEGPLPPDTAFLDWRREQTDAHICMYHDQGLIPLKTLAFDSAINITLGLPIVRTSVDHGTALDIAWQNKANPRSLFEAVSLAVRLSGSEGNLVERKTSVLCSDNSRLGNPRSALQL